jgi:multiple sugar transport system permease protein
VAAVAGAEPRGRGWRDVFEERRFLAPLLIAPAVIFIALLVGGPLILAIYLSLTDATAGSLTGEFVGFRNFTEAWDDPNSAGLLAHALVKSFRGKWIARFLILLPWAAPVALSTIGFLWLFDSLFSVVNWVLIRDTMPGGGEFHLYKVVNWLFARDWLPDRIEIAPIEPLNPPQWLGQPTLALGAVTAVHAWRIIPFATVIFIAGLASIPSEVEDAAKVDGATGLKKFWYVTLPLQLPIALVALLFGIVFTATDMVVVFVLTHGGPFNSTHMLTTWAFDTGITSSALGQGAAISLFLLPVLVVVAVVMLFFARRAEVA